MATEKIDCALLEDETLVNHLSGTLTFSDIASLDGVTDSLLGSDASSPPNLTETTEEGCHDQKMVLPPQPIRFEVIDASVVEEKGDKHVVYTILVMQSVGFDSMPGKVYKRYSELNGLRRELEQQYPALVRNISFPSKRIVGNFSSSTLLSRSRAFEKFLTNIFSIRELRFSKTFIKFLYGNNLTEGYRLIENGLYEKSAELLVASWKLQNKIVLTKSYQCVMTLMAVVASYCSLNNVDQAQLFSDLALQSFPDPQRDGSISNVLDSKWQVALLRTNIKLCRVLSRDSKRNEAKLQDLKKRGISIDQRESLLEMILHNKQLWHSMVEEGSNYG